MTKDSPSASIRDVAQLAGVSLGSASRVLNGASNVTEEVRLRVMKAVAQLSYRPNHAAQTLRRRASMTVGCVLPDVTNQIFGQMFHAIENRFRRSGYVTLMANGLHHPDREVEILTTFRGRGIDGLVIAPGDERDAALTRALGNLDMPVVVLNSDIAVAKDFVQFDYLSGVQAAVDYLVHLGHRKVAMVLSESGRRSTRERIAALRSSLAAHGLTFDDSNLIQLATSMSSSFPAVSLLLDRKDRPTAILALGTDILLETLNAISSKGLSIPGDISVIALGDPAYARNYVPPLTCIRIDPERVAEYASALLLDSIRSPSAYEPRVVSVTADFIIRQSCGPVPS